MSKRIAQYPFEQARWTRPVLRALVATVCASPLAGIAIGITGSPKFPTVLGYVISPGNVAERWPVSGGFADSLSATLFRMLAINVAYYAALLFMLFTWRLSCKRQ